MRIRNSRILDYLILLLILLFGMWPIVSGVATMKWDVMDIYLPWKYFVGESIRNGNLPLWNPFLNSGFPQMGDVNTWYPISWIISLFGKYNVISVHFEYLFHLYLAGIGMYMIAQYYAMQRKTRLLMAVSYMFCGFFISNAQHVGWIISAAWFPFIYYYFVKLCSKPDFLNAIKLGICSFLMLSGGYPGIFISSFYILFGLAVYQFARLLLNREYARLRKWVLYLSLSALIFVLLSAVIIVSSLDLAKHITRGGGLPFDKSHWGILTGSLPPKALITLIFPYAASINESSFWGTDFSIIDCYIGIIPLLLLIFTAFQKDAPLKFRIFVVIGILFLLTAFAEVTPIRKWLYLYLPFMDIFRFSALFRIFTIFFFLIGAGFALEYLLKDQKFQRNLFIYFVIALIILVSIEVYLFFHIEKWQFKQILSQGFSSFDKIAGIKEKMFFQGMISIGIVTLLAIVIKFKPKFILLTMICLGTADMALATRLNLYATVVSDFPARKVNEAFSNLPTGYPALSLQLPMIKTTDTALLGRIPYLWRNLAIYQKIPSCDGNSPYSLYTMSTAINNKNYEVTLSYPLLFLTSLKNNESIIDTNSIDIDSYKKITIDAFNPNSIQLKVNSDSSKYLVFQQNIYPYWQARINGHSSQILKVNDTYMGVLLEKGKNEVLFEFKPAKVTSAFYVSLVSIIGVIVLLIISIFIKVPGYKLHKVKTSL